MSPPLPPPIGRLNRRLQIEAPILNSDGTAAWTDLATVWGQVENLGFDERDIAGRIEGIARWRLTIRWRADVTSSNRVLYGTRVLRLVSSADPAGDRRFLTIEAEEEQR